MKEILINRLYHYLVQNNPEIVVPLQQEEQNFTYLKEKIDALGELPEQLLAEGHPHYIIEEICMEELTKEFRPSRYNYLLNVLEEDFQSEYSLWQEAGTLTQEVLPILNKCEPAFDSKLFTEENENDRMFRYAIIKTIREYLICIKVDREYLNKIDFSYR